MTGSRPLCVECGRPGYGDPPVAHLDRRIGHPFVAGPPVTEAELITIAACPVCRAVWTPGGRVCHFCAGTNGNR